MADVGSAGKECQEDLWKPSSAVPKRGAVILQISFQLQGGFESGKSESDAAEGRSLDKGPRLRSLNCVGYFFTSVGEEREGEEEGESGGMGGERGR